MDCGSGRYAVVTSSGTTYVVDMDETTVSRCPDRRRKTWTEMRFDHVAVDLILIVECSVGRPMHYAVNLHIPGVRFTARSTSTVVSIALLNDVPIDRARGQTDG